MKLKKLAVLTISLSVLTLVGCGKKKTEIATDQLPQINPLKTAIELYFTDYSKQYEKSEDGTYSLVASNCIVSLLKHSDFAEPEIFSFPDSTLPDSAQGEYDRFTMVNDDSLHFSFGSVIAGEMIENELGCGIEESEGSFIYDEVSLTSFETFFADQIEKGYNPTVEEMMWNTVESQLSSLLTPEEVRSRYALTLTSEKQIENIPAVTFSANDSTASIDYGQSIHFLVQYSGAFSVIK